MHNKCNEFKQNEFKQYQILTEATFIDNKDARWANLKCKYELESNCLSPSKNKRAFSIKKLVLRLFLIVLKSSLRD